MIEEDPIADLGDDEDAEFIGGPIFKKSKEKKKGQKHFIFQQS